MTHLTSANIHGILDEFNYASKLSGKKKNFILENSSFVNCLDTNEMKR